MSDIKCFHCDLPVPSKTVYQLMIFNDMRRMCCPGCLAIAEFICSNGLDDYYHYRDRPALKGDEVIPKELSIFDTYDSNSLQQSVISHDKAGISKITLTIEGISCAACTWLIERHIKAIPGIRSFFVNLSTSKAQVSWDKKQLPLSKLLLEFTRIGYKASPYTVQKQEQLHQQEYKKGLQKIIIAGIGMMQVMMLAVALYLGKAGDLAVHHWVFIRFISFIVATFVLFFAAQDFFYSAWRSLKAKTLGMDVPISLSLGIAYCASIYNTIHNAGDIYFDSVCMFTFFLLVSRFLEMRARHRSCNTIYALQKLTVGMTTVVGIDHMEIKMPVNDLNIDDHILVKPGELIPVDGVVLEGDSCVDEAMLTGESYPASKKIGNTVLGGTYNIENALLIKVSKKAINSKFSTIVQLLEQAGSAKPSITNLADKVTGYFVMVVLLLTLVVSMIWLYVDTQNVLKIILSMLVITCPCALSLATPVAVTNCTNY